MSPTCGKALAQCALPNSDTELLLGIAVPRLASIHLTIPGNGGALAEAIEGSVVDKVPDADPNDAVLALVDLGGFNDLFLERGREPPIDHVTRAPLVIGGHHKARIVRSQACCEHAATPWPPLPGQVFTTASFWLAFNYQNLVWIFSHLEHETVQRS